MLSGYRDVRGRCREIVVRAGHAGSSLVIDRDVATGGDARLVAHLAADEPAGNAVLVCRLYLQDARVKPYACRSLTDEDAARPPFADAVEPLRSQPERQADGDALAADATLHRLGRSFRLEPVQGAMSIPELRWRMYTSAKPDADGVSVSLREVVAHLERYEPALTLTARALRREAEETRASVAVLRLELTRMQESPIVLNRRLREVVLATAARERLSMSEIALRCGRIKRDAKGNENGETSWLTRRLGLLAEGGQSSPTPWIHSDVLALIARRGLGISPREVEL